MGVADHHPLPADPAHREAAVVHIMFDGRIVKEGGPELVEQLEREGYGRIREEVGGGGMSPLAARTPRDFPVLAREGLAYLDTARDVADAAPVIEAMDALLPRAPRVASTAASTRSPREATEAYEGARDRVAAFAGLDAGRDDLHPQRDGGDQPRRLRVGPRERRAPATASWSPRWSTTRTSCRGSMLAQRAGARARRRRRSTTRAGSSSTSSTRCSRAGPKLVAVAHVSNVLGTINPVAEIAAPRARGRRARARRRLAGRRRRSRSTSRALGADFYAWTGHKAYGPTGIGVLHGRRELLEAMPPFLGGGHMIATRRDRRDPLGRAAREVRGRHVADRRGGRPRRRGRLPRAASAWTRVREHERDLVAYALERLADVAGPRRSTARPTLDARGASSRSRSTAPTRTTSPRSSAARASASAPATTARSR